MVYQVDAHNVVPVWQASPKQEYAARTIRSKIHRQLDRFWTRFPELSPQSADTALPTAVDWAAVYTSLEVDQDVPPVRIAQYHRLVSGHNLMAC